MLGLPEATALKKVIPKKVFYAKFALNTAEQNEFDNAIRQMAIVNEISSRTIPALSGKQGDKAIYVLWVQLKQPQCDEKIINKLARLIDQRIILALSYEDKLQLALFYNKLIKDERESAEKKRVSLKGLSLDDVWDNIALSLAEIEAEEGQSADEAINVKIREEALQKEIGALTKKLWAEKQPRKKLALREKINQLKRYMSSCS